MISKKIESAINKQINKELFPAIGICLPARGYGFKKVNFRNVPSPMGGSSPFPYPATGASEQFFFAKT